MLAVKSLKEDASDTETNETRALAAGTSYLVKRIMPFPGEARRGEGEYYSGLTSINDADAQKTTTDALNKSQSTPSEGLFVEATLCRRVRTIII